MHNLLFDWHYLQRVYLSLGDLMIMPNHEQKEGEVHLRQSTTIFLSDVHY